MQWNESKKNKYCYQFVDFSKTVIEKFNFIIPRTGIIFFSNSQIIFNQISQTKFSDRAYVAIFFNRVQDSKDFFHFYTPYLENTFRKTKDNDKEAH